MCQRNGWKSPKYSCVKEGEDHIPLFRASVVVNGKKFRSSAPVKKSKDAYNDVSKIAFSRYSAKSRMNPFFAFVYLDKLLKCC